VYLRDTESRLEGIDLGILNVPDALLGINVLLQVLKDISLGLGQQYDGAANKGESLGIIGIARGVVEDSAAKLQKTSLPRCIKIRNMGGPHFQALGHGVGLVRDDDKPFGLGGRGRHGAL